MNPGNGNFSIECDISSPICPAKRIIRTCTVHKLITCNLKLKLEHHRRAAGIDFIRTAWGGATDKFAGEQVGFMAEFNCVTYWILWLSIWNDAKKRALDICALFLWFLSSCARRRRSMICTFDDYARQHFAWHVCSFIHLLHVNARRHIGGAIHNHHHPGGAGGGGWQMPLKPSTSCRL